MVGKRSGQTAKFLQHVLIIKVLPPGKSPAGWSKNGEHVKRTIGLRTKADETRFSGHDPQNLRKQRKNQVAAGSGERFRKGKWRRGWDSNPRYAFTHAGFQDRCLKPLGHPSASGMKARNRCLMVRHGSGILCLCAAGKSKNAKITGSPRLAVLRLR